MSDSRQWPKWKFFFPMLADGWHCSSWFAFFFLYCGMIAYGNWVDLLNLPMHSTFAIFNWGYHDLALKGSFK